jgi:hypothetical protein
MMKVTTWIIAACLVIGLIAYGVTGFGEQTVSAEVSQAAKGSFVRLDDSGKKIIAVVDGKETTYTLSSTVWVYRNMQKSALSELKPGDTLDIILNSKDQAAYIKAVQQQPPAAVQAPAAEPSTAAAPTPPAAGAAAGQAALPAPDPTAATTAPAVSPAPNPGLSGQQAANPKPTDTPSNPSAVASVSLDKLVIEWKSSELQLQVKREGSAQGQGVRDVYIRTHDHAVIHLTGTSAEAFIQLLVSGLPTEQKAFEQQLKQKIAAQFQLKDTKPEWKLDAQWKDTPIPVSTTPVSAPGKVQEQQVNQVQQQDDKGKYKVKDNNKDNKNKENEQNQDKSKDKHRGDD